MAGMKKPDLSSALGVTMGEKYGYAVELTDRREAAAYFEECVNHTMKFGHSREQAVVVEKHNIAYYAGYYDDAVRARVEELYECAHQVFGAIAEKGPVSAEEAFRMGAEAARENPEPEDTELPEWPES